MEDEYRLYKRVVSWCSTCPAHHCNLETEETLCRCDITNRIIPQSMAFDAFPAWCPLKKCTEKGGVKK